MDNIKKRIDWIDIAKGIGILLMLIGHTSLCGGITEFTIKSTIYAFHMPLFFILSGYTFNNDKFSIKKSAKMLLVPYMIVVATFGITSIIGLAPSYYSIKTFLYVLITGRCKLPDRSIGAAAAWFFMAMFVARIYLHIVLKAKKRILQILLAFICLTISIVFSYIDIVLPFQLDIAGICAFYMYIGYFAKENNFGKYKWALMIVALILFQLRRFSSGVMSIASEHYLFLDYGIIVAIAGTILVIFVAQLLEHSIIKKPLQFLGKNTKEVLITNCIYKYVYLNSFGSITSDWRIEALLELMIQILVAIIFVWFQQWYSKIIKSQIKRRTCLHENPYH